MNPVRFALSLLDSAIAVYTLLCFVRLVSTWFPPSPGNKAIGFLGSVTDPWLLFFSRSGRFRMGQLDFSPVVALSALSILGRAVHIAAVDGRVGVGIVLGAALQSVWSALAFFIAFFAVLILVRGVAYALRWNSLHPAWRAVDGLINPVVFKTNRLVYRNRIVNYLQGLGTAFVLLAATRTLFGLGVRELVKLLETLPF